MGFGLIANSVFFFLTYLKFTSDLCNEVLYRLINEYLMHIKLLQMLSLYMSCLFCFWIQWTSFYIHYFIWLMGMGLVFLQFLRNFVFNKKKNKQISNLNGNSLISKHSDPA